jgi:ribosomal protein S18 acetylase RimI-like enzyme
MNEAANFIRLLARSDTERAVGVMSSAFRNDPLWQYLVPDDGRRAILLKKFFSVMLGLAISNNQAYGISEPLNGISIGSAPTQNKTKLPITTVVDAAKLLFIPFLISFFRSLRIFTRFEAMQKKYAPKPHYYLTSIGVLPEFQGQGLASTLIRPFLKRADEEHVSVYTETMTPSNVPLYNHYGFQSMEEFKVPKTDLRIWALYRPNKISL